ncbi:pre-mRNA-splicing factor cwc22-like [Eucalyptus grandis]|uniref:pre-mRNA-splicing factor cwc22-like n=1 Tax=Eucalyptus grandis TaxID=71139 RepID=UPI00192ECB5E|nr:pre-mRNA-splicing factor cwc22-like [Eucalyptus grandis]
MAASFSHPLHLKCPFSSVFSRAKSLSQKSFSASFDTDDQHRPSALLVRRYSISAAATAASSPPSQLPLASKIQSGFEQRMSLSTSASFDANDQHRPSAPSSGGTRSPPPPPRRPCSSRWSQGLERLRAAEVVVDLRLLRRRRPAPAEGPLVRRYSISAAAASSPPSQLPLASKVQSGFEPRKSSSTSASFDADDQHRQSAPSCGGTRSPPPPPPRRPRNSRWPPRSSGSRTMSSLRGRITWS